MTPLATHDVLLIDPTPEALAAALPPGVAGDEARRTLGRLLGQSPEGVRPFLARSPRGRDECVEVAWWTDRAGVRRVRVLADRGERWRAPEALDGWPPLWFVHPERVFRVTRGGRSRWVAVCACGVAGEPAALAWAGPCCGPCRDRLHDGLPPDPGLTPAARHRVADAAVQGLDFSPAGDQLACVTGARLLLLDLHTGGRQTLVEGRWSSSHQRPVVAWSPDGRTLAVGHPQLRGVSLYELVGAGGGPAEVQAGHLLTDSGAFQEGQVYGVAFSPDGGTLLAVSHNEGARLWRRRGGAWERGGRIEGATACAFTRDGEGLLIGTWPVPGADSGTDAEPPLSGEVLLALRDGADWGTPARLARLARPAEAVAAVHRAPDGRLHALCATEAEALEPLGEDELWTTRLYAWDRRGAPAGCESLSRPHALAFSPDGGHLARVGASLSLSPAAVVVRDLRAGADVATLEADPAEPITDLAFSPDGTTLASAGARGTVTLWPWRQLLDG